MLLCVLVVELALFEAVLAHHEECAAQVVVTSQEDLVKLVRAEVTDAFQSFTTITATTTNDSDPERLQDVIYRMENKLDSIIERLDSLQEKVKVHHQLGLSAQNAASSCAEVLEKGPVSPSGYYWVTNATGHPHSVYCDMTRSCGGVAGGWMRVAYLDMTNTSHQCPSGLRQRTDSGVRTCAPYSDSATCSSILHESIGFRYSSVCGKIEAFHVPMLEGFNNRVDSIDSYYVDGVSLTHGRSPRHHIWSFSGGLEIGAPSFVGNDYFCEAHIATDYSINLNNLMWDGKDCGSSHCCSFNNPPWFSKQLLQPTTDDVEMRVCRDQSQADEDIAVQSYEIYIK